MLTLLNPYNLQFWVNVTEGEKAQGYSEEWELHSEEVPKAPWGTNSTWWRTVACSSRIKIGVKGDAHEKIEKRSTNVV